MYIGALEAGGTKMVCAIYTTEMEFVDRVSFPTTTPDETMPKLIEYYKKFDVKALGVGGFGPLDLNKQSKTFGYITTTPKLAWCDYPLLPTLQKALGIPMEIDTDVNVAAYAEYTLGAAKGLSSCLYVTVGTGIGGGLILENMPVHGLVHPEIGHMLLCPSKDDPAPIGVCPYHASCLEGLATGPSVEKRWGKKAYDLPEDHPAWTLEVEYLSQMCANAIFFFSPEKIILGGGVMQQAHLFPRIHKRTLELLGNYVAHSAILEHIDTYIVAPGLGTTSGAMGAMLLALKALENEKG